MSICKQEKTCVLLKNECIFWKKKYSGQTLTNDVI